MVILESGERSSKRGVNTMFYVEIYLSNRNPDSHYFQWRIQDFLDRRANPKRCQPIIWPIFHEKLLEIKDTLEWRRIANMLVEYLKKCLMDTCTFFMPLNPCFGHPVTSPLSFKALSRLGGSVHD